MLSTGAAEMSLMQSPGLKNLESRGGDRNAKRSDDTYHALNYLQCCGQGWGVRCCNRGLLRSVREREAIAPTLIEYLLCAKYFKTFLQYSPFFFTSLLI